MHPRGEEKILAAILTEAKESGITPIFIALIERIYDNQQELSRCLNNLQNSSNWERKRTEKRIQELEEKVDPEKAAKRKKDEVSCEKASGSSNSCVLGTL